MQLEFSGLQYGILSSGSRSHTSFLRSWLMIHIYCITSLRWLHALSIMNSAEGGGLFLFAILRLGCGH